MSLMRDPVREEYARAHTHTCILEEVTIHRIIISITPQTYNHITTLSAPSYSPPPPRNQESLSHYQT